MSVQVYRLTPARLCQHLPPESSRKSKKFGERGAQVVCPLRRASHCLFITGSLQRTSAKCSGEFKGTMKKEERVQTLIQTLGSDSMVAHDTFYLGYFSLFNEQKYY